MLQSLYRPGRIKTWANFRLSGLLAVRLLQGL